MSWIDCASVPEWIGAVANTVVAFAAIAAAWRYFTVYSVPWTAELHGGFSGQSFVDGKQISDHHSWQCALRNNSQVPSHVKYVSLQRLRFGFLWISTKDGLTSLKGSFPTSIMPGGSLELFVSREKKDIGTYRLKIREYGSMRRCVIPLIDLNHADVPVATRM
jgi:hypothetical protein